MGDKPRTYIFIDTCSLLETCWNRVSSKGEAERYEYSKSKDATFWDREFRSLEAIGDVIIPARNYEELLKHSKKNAGSDLAKRAREILTRINRLHQSGRIQIVGDPNDPFADAILLSVALKFRTRNNMAFITQDRKLAEDLEAIRHFRSVEPRMGYDIKIRRVSRSGSLEQHKGLWAGTRAPSSAHGSKRKGEGSGAQSKSSSALNWWE